MVVPSLKHYFRSKGKSKSETSDFFTFHVKGICTLIRPKKVSLYNPEFIYKKVNKKQKEEGTPVKEKYTDSEVPINVCETPAIQKNKKMRSGRRSSLSLRGKRVSEAFNGLCRNK